MKESGQKRVDIFDYAQPPGGGECENREGQDFHQGLIRLPWNVRRFSQEIVHVFLKVKIAHGLISGKLQQIKRCDGKSLCRID
ncbi:MULTISPECIES: hypothetical protein [Pirellulaceae]|uniref:hypothetical protein n=1 Tax=Pirellulaceae TaxID=2691357 RepID=UPI000CFA61C0|nr:MULTISPECIES: hypothetical protein [Pirellulaceae]